VNSLSAKKNTKQFATAWDDYAKKYNKLSDALHEKGIDCRLLDEVIDSRTNFLKTCLIIKFDEMGKI
jgi:hypothetical protein